MDHQTAKRELIAMIDEIESKQLILKLKSIILREKLNSSKSDPLDEIPIITSLVNIDSHLYQRTKPIWISWKGETQESIKSWKGFYLGVISHLIKEGLLKAENCPYPDRYGKTRFMISRNDIHKNGKRFTIPEEIEGFHIECHGSSEDLIKNTLHILNQCGVSPDIVQVAFI